MKFKGGIGRDQDVLIPSRIEDYIGEEHLAKLVVTICDSLDISRIEKKYSRNGQHAYDPRMMTSLLFYGYSIGTRSSRKIAESCHERLDFMYITRNLMPTHDRISDFRKDNLKELFTQIVMIGSMIGIIEMGNIRVSIDGTKMRANASAKLTKDEAKLKGHKEQVEKEINDLFNEAQKTDAEEDMKRKIMKKMGSKNSRKDAIKDALETLQKQKEEARNKIAREKDREPTKAETKKIEKMKINITDQDAKYMKERSGVIKPNYNGQISVDEKNQFILANDLVTDCNDQHQLIPIVQKTCDNLGRHPDMVKGDNGYYPQLQEAVKTFTETEFYIDDKKRRKQNIDMEETRKKYDDIQYSNLEKLLTPEGNMEYRKRMHTAEPPFGWMKFNSGYRYFLLRGKEKAGGEFNLMCIGYNFKKILYYLRKKDTVKIDAGNGKIMGRGTILPA